LNIISPEFSFLDFNYIDNDVCDNQSIVSLPVCNDLSIKAQFSIESETETPTTEALYIAIADEDCNVILDNDIEVTPICSKYKFYTTYEEAEVLDTNPYNLCNTSNNDPILTQEFTINPFDLITSDDFSFELTFPKQTQLQLYIQTKKYILEWNTSALTEINQLDNVYFVKIGYNGADTSSGRRTKFLSFLNDVIDVNHGTTSSLSVGVFTIEDIPEASYLNNSYGFINSESTTDVSGNIGKDFYWEYDSIKFQSIGTPVTPLFSFEVALTYTDAYDFRYKYSALYTDFEGTITIDNGIDPPTVKNILFDSYSGEVTISYFATTTGTHTVTIEITNFGEHKNGLTINSIEQYNTVIFNVTNNISGNIPIGSYGKSELIALISSILGFDFDCEFTSCCEVPEIEFNILLADDDTIYNYKLSSYWEKGFINFPELPLDSINNDCFAYAILDSEKKLIACSNLFHKEDDCCYITKIEYSNNEDSFGFTYPEGVTNMVSLPFFLHSPSYPTTEKIYKQTNGIYKRLSADIEKEYECETDYFNEQIHDKLITALKHDIIIVTSNRLGITDQMTQQGDYNLNWNSKIEFTAMAEFKLKKYFNGKNSNCGSNC